MQTNATEASRSIHAAFKHRAYQIVRAGRELEEGERVERREGLGERSALGPWDDVFWLLR